MLRCVSTEAAANETACGLLASRGILRSSPTILAEACQLLIKYWLGRRTTDFRSESKTIESATRLCSANHRLKQELKHVETLCACGASTRHASIQQEDASRCHQTIKLEAGRLGNLPRCIFHFDTWSLGHHGGRYKIIRRYSWANHGKSPWNKWCLIRMTSPRFLFSTPSSLDFGILVWDPVLQVLQVQAFGNRNACAQHLTPSYLRYVMLRAFCHSGPRLLRQLFAPFGTCAPWALVLFFGQAPFRLEGFRVISGDNFELSPG